MNKGRIKFILLWAFLIISFVILAVILILEANGYRLNRQTWALEPTGVIVLDGQPRQIQLIINGQSSSDSLLPVKLFQLLPGQYDITIKKEDYQTWSKTFWLSGGQAIEAKHIQLFITSPKVTASTRKLALADMQKDFRSQGSDLALKENEIWYNEKLVTRFAEKPVGAILTNDRNHIIFQLGSELRVMDIDGTNNFKLIILPDNSAIAFVLYGNILVYASNNENFEADIK